MRTGSCNYRDDATNELKKQESCALLNSGKKTSEQQASLVKPAPRIRS